MQHVQDTINEKIDQKAYQHVDDKRVIKSKIVSLHNLYIFISVTFLFPFNVVLITFRFQFHAVPIQFQAPSAFNVSISFVLSPFHFHYDLIVVSRVSFSFYLHFHVVPISF